MRREKPMVTKKHTVVVGSLVVAILFVATTRESDDANATGSVHCLTRSSFSRRANGVD